MGNASALDHRERKQLALTLKQGGVARGMAIGAVCTVVALAGAAFWQPQRLLPDDNTVARIAFALTFYPTVVILAASVVVLIRYVAGG